MLKFDPVEHKYTFNGNELTSVTTMLKEVGIIDDRFYVPSATNRGTLVHKQTELLDKGELDWGTVTDETLPYIEAWVNYSRGMNFIGIEELLFHPLLNYAGTIDRVSDEYILDIKTGAKAKWHRLQLTLYGMMWEAKTGEKKKIGCVYLTKKGTYKFQPYEWDLKTAMAIVRVTNWKKSK